MTPISNDLYRVIDDGKKLDVFYSGIVRSAIKSSAAETRQLLNKMPKELTTGSWCINRFLSACIRRPLDPRVYETR